MDGAGLNVVLELRPEAGDRDVRLSKSGCQGFCQMGPLVSVVPDGILYTKVCAEDVPEIVEQTLVNGEVVDRLLYKDPATRKNCRGLEDNPFYATAGPAGSEGMRLPRSRRYSRISCCTAAIRLRRKRFLRCLRKKSARQISESGLRGPRRRRVSNGAQMGGGARAEVGKEVRHLQRRRRRSRRVYESLGDGRQSAQRD